MEKMRKIIVVFLVIVCLAAAMPEKVLAWGGTILSLTVSGGATPNSTITIQSTVRASTRINNSNLYYRITGPGTDATIRATHRTSVGRLNNNQTYPDSWTTTNTGWPLGNYTVQLCWSRNNGSSCDVASATTTFYSVPTLGWGLSLVGLAFLLFFLWRQRKEFEPAMERIRP
jgi:hypothetical protein